MNFYTHESLYDFRKALESKGYKKFNVSPGSVDYGKYDFLYQKWVTDDVGKRYAINIRFYNMARHIHWRSDIPKWSCDAYLYLNTPDLAVEGCEEYGAAWITFECNSIESVELFAEKVFKNLNGCYYERWNEG